MPICCKRSANCSALACAAANSSWVVANCYLAAKALPIAASSGKGKAGSACILNNLAQFPIRK